MSFAGQLCTGGLCISVTAVSIPWNPRSELSAWQRIIYRQIQRYGGVATDTNSESKGGSMRGVSNIIMQL